MVGAFFFRAIQRFFFLSLTSSLHSVHCICYASLIPLMKNHKEIESRTALDNCFTIFFFRFFFLHFADRKKNAIALQLATKVILLCFLFFHSFLYVQAHTQYTWHVWFDEKCATKDESENGRAGISGRLGQAEN